MINWSDFPKSLHKKLDIVTRWKPELHFKNFPCDTPHTYIEMLNSKRNAYFPSNGVRRKSLRILLKLRNELSHSGKD